MLFSSTTAILRPDKQYKQNHIFRAVKDVLSNIFWTKPPMGGVFNDHIILSANPLGNIIVKVW